MYDKAEEYLVVVSEKGQREQTKEQEEIHRKVGKAHMFIYSQFARMSFNPHFHASIEQGCHHNPSHTIPTGVPYMISHLEMMGSLNALISLQKSALQADTAPELEPDAFDGVERMAARIQAEKRDSLDEAAEASEAQEVEAGQHAWPLV